MQPSEPQLFSRGTRMREVPVNFHGINPTQWQGLSVHAQCEKYLASLGPVAERNARAPLAGARITTARGDYGWRPI